MKTIHHEDGRHRNIRIIRVERGENNRRRWRTRISTDGTGEQCEHIYYDRGFVFGRYGILTYIHWSPNLIVLALGEFKFWRSVGACMS